MKVSSGPLAPSPGCPFELPATGTIRQVKRHLSEAAQLPPAALTLSERSRNNASISSKITCRINMLRSRFHLKESDHVARKSLHLLLILADTL